MSELDPEPLREIETELREIASDPQLRSQDQARALLTVLED